MTINVVANDGDGRDYLAEVVAGMNARFEELRCVNPRGYRDEYESRMDVLLMEVVAGLGGRVEYQGGETVCNFSAYPSECFRLPT